MILLIKTKRRLEKWNYRTKPENWCFLLHDVTKAIKGGFLFTTLNYVSIIIGVLISIIIISILGPSEYGIYSAVSTLIALLNFGTIGALGIPIITEVAKASLDKDKEKYCIIFSVGLFISFLLIIICVILYVVIYYLYYYSYLERYDSYILLLCILIIILRGFTFTLSSFIKGFIYYKELVIITFSKNFFYYLIIILYLTFFKIIFIRDIFIALFCSELVALILSSLYFKRMIKLNNIDFKFVIKRNYISKFLKGFFYEALGFTFYSTFFNIDSLILPAFLPFEIIGYYYFAKTITLIINNGLSNIKSFFLPLFSKQQKEISLKYTSLSIRFSIFITNAIIIPFIILSKNILSIIAFFVDGFNQYVAAYLLLSIFLSIVVIIPFKSDISILYESLYAYDKILYSNAIALIVYLTSTGFFIFTFINTKLLNITSYVKCIFFVILFIIGFLSSVLYLGIAIKRDNLNIKYLHLIFYQILLSISAIILSYFISNFLNQFNYILLTIFLFIIFSVLIILFQIYFLRIINRDDIVLVAKLFKKRYLIYQILIKLYKLMPDSI